MKVKITLPGTVRIKAVGLKVYERSRKGWKRSSRTFPEALLVIKLFKAHKRFSALIDKKNPEFLKGQLSPDGQPQGARINVLPNGKKLDKAFSLFSPELTIHNENSNYHWNVLYKNPGGTYSYVYTLEKKKELVKRKYQVVKDFERYFRKLRKNLRRALHDPEDAMAVPMYTLLKTYMRIGNEIYYKTSGHKGLTTLKKKDITIRKNQVTFNYIGKDGVPIEIKRRFPDIYIERLRKILKSKKRNEYVFINGHTRRPLQDIHFREAFKRYCGKEFFPHIVRSYFATARVKYFLKTRKEATKEDIRELYLEIAERLGHKRFDKKNQVWKENSTVTISHYIKPKLLAEVEKIVMDNSKLKINDNGNGNKK
ncbi:MAG: hypothetical protein JXD21_01120 [Candidatus Omnitrophica bacterium]|nr:hypothetical protein [Candidatus Omnitrophota bacterium]